MSSEANAGQDTSGGDYVKLQGDNQEGDTGAQHGEEEVHERGLHHAAESEPASQQPQGDDGAEAAESEQSTEGGEKRSGKLENREAIPTAGGERLGDQHWGESKIVPDNPQKSEQQQVSSEEGQPDKQTASNTAQNTGGAAPSAGGEGQSKPTMTEKIKDKLHMG